MISAEEYAAAGIEPPKSGFSPSTSSALRSFRRAKAALSMLKKVTFVRELQPCFLPGQSTAEDEEAERTKMAEVVSHDAMVSLEWEEAHIEIEEEILSEQKKSTAQMSCNTVKALHNRPTKDGLVSGIEMGKDLSVEALESAMEAACREEQMALKAAKEAERERVEAQQKYEEALAQEAEWERESREDEMKEDAVLLIARQTAFSKAAKAEGKKLAHGVAKSLSKMAQSNLERQKLEHGIQLEEEEARAKARSDELRRKEEAAQLKAAALEAEAKDKPAQPVAVKENTSLISESGCLQMRPITNFYGENGPRDDKLTVYSAFMDNGCKLYAPTEGPIVVGAPFTFCLETNNTVKEIGVLADGEFPYVLQLKPDVRNESHLFYGHLNPEVPDGRCDSLTFYQMVSNGSGQELSGMFQWQGCITKSEALAKGSSKEEEVAALS